MITYKVILEAVCYVTGVTPEDILKDRKQQGAKDKDVCYARQLCMYLARKYDLGSSISVAKFYGHRDHATCLHAEKTIQNELDLYTQKRVIYTQVQVKILEYTQAELRGAIEVRIDQLLKEFERKARKITDEILTQIEKI